MSSSNWADRTSAKYSLENLIKGGVSYAVLLLPAEEHVQDSCQGVLAAAISWFVHPRPEKLDLGVEEWNLFCCVLLLLPCVVVVVTAGVAGEEGLCFFIYVQRKLQSAVL